MSNLFAGLPGSAFGAHVIVIHMNHISWQVKQNRFIWFRKMWTWIRWLFCFFVKTWLWFTLRRIKHWCRIAQILHSHFRLLLTIFIGHLFISLCMPIVENFHTSVNFNASCFSDNAPLPSGNKDNTDLQIRLWQLLCWIQNYFALQN